LNSLREDERKETEKKETEARIVLKGLAAVRPFFVVARGKGSRADVWQSVVICIPFWMGRGGSHYPRPPREKKAQSAMQPYSGRVEAFSPDHLFENPRWTLPR